jgi:enamine deaminase RidA (YjgF/YER057c/UK114 family)
MAHDSKPTSGGHTVLQPSGWPRAKGYSNGIKARGDIVFIAGQVGWDAQGKFAGGFVEQAKQALHNIVAVLAEGGGKPEHIVRMTWYLRDMAMYKAALPQLGEAYREVIGRHYPVMTAVEISRLDVPAALVEIEATAVVPS